MQRKVLVNDNQQNLLRSSYLHAIYGRFFSTCVLKYCPA